jgi:hypothetical protein
MRKTCSAEDTRYAPRRRLQSDNDIKKANVQERMLQDLHGEGVACLAGQCTVLFIL